MSGSTKSGGVLTPLQRAIMDVVVAKGPVTSEQLRKALQKIHPLKDSSVRTLLRRLEARGLLSHTVEGKVFRYRAETSPARVAANEVKSLIDTVWAGSAERCLVALVAEKVISATQLERVARKVSARRGRSIITP